METVLRHCSSCGEEREFEAPPCDDGHGCDCPELVCLMCGEALMVTDGPLAVSTMPAYVHHAA